MDAQHWLLTVRADPGAHVDVEVRVGPVPRDRALAGRLRLRVEEYRALRDMLLTATTSPACAASTYAAVALNEPAWLAEDDDS